jgi:uncharacterized membrane protein
VVLNFASTYKLDVAGFSPLGADRFAHWASFYGNTPNPAGDHYGPVVYLAYVPFELVWPYHGEPDPLATHFANLTFDLLTALIIFRLARRLGGTGAGIAATFAWLSLPLTLLALCSGSNDGLVALLMVGALAVVGRPVLAGALTGAAALTKIAPALAIPAIAVHPGIADPSLHRRLLRFLPAVAAVVCVVVAFVLKTTPLSTFLDRTLHSQENLFSPLSIWSFYDPAATSPVLYDLQSLVRAAAAALAVILAIWPRQRDTAQLAALCGAVLIAAQLGATYWI